MLNDPGESYEDIRKRLNNLVSNYSQSQKNSPITEPVSADERIKQIKAKGLEQDIDLKKDTLQKLFKFLSLETLVIFVYAYFQATKLLNFKLEEWSFKLLVSATLLQITYMLQVAVKHLFPSKTIK